MIKITDQTKHYLKKATEDTNKKYAHLTINSGGCSGFQYEWTTVDEVENGTLIEDTLVLDKLAEMYVIGCTIDYVKEFGGSYLKVVNPNATASCGCGESFAV